MSNFDTIIVGGGIIGSACAFYLTKRGMRVLLVEKHILGQGTTGNSFGWINATSKTSDEGYHRLNAAGVAAHAALVDEFGAKQLGLNPTGALGMVRRSDTTGYIAALNQSEILLGFGYDCHWIDRNELCRMEPNIAFAEDAEAMFTPADGALVSPAFSKFLADKVCQTGMVLENCAALEIETDDNGAITGLLTEQGAFQAPNLIVAAGPNTPEVLSSLTDYGGFTARFPITKVPGLIMTTPPVPSGLVRHIFYTSPTNEVHFLPDASGGLRIGSDDIDGQVVEDQSADHLRELGMQLLGRTQAHIPGFTGADCIDDCRLGIGFRAYPEDGVSIVGGMPGAEGLYVIATHSGVTLAPVLGRLMAELVDTGEVPTMLQPFGLERLAGFG